MGVLVVTGLVVGGQEGRVAVDLDLVKAQKMMLGVANVAQDHPLVVQYD